MRPLPVILVLVALAAALVYGVFLVGRGEAVHPVPSAERVHGATEPAEAAASGAPALDATGAESADSSRAAPVVAAEAPPTSKRETKKAAPTVALSGRVLGNLGKPVEGATLYAAESNDLLSGGLDEIDPGQTTWIHRAEAVTDHDGRFRIRPESGAKVNLAIRAPGFAPFDREFSISSAERDLGDIALDPSVVLSGRVVDSTGRSVAGARIARLAGADSGFSFFGGPRGATVATTDSQGAFRVDQLAAGAWHLLVTHEDHPDHVESGEADRAGAVVSGLVVTLEEGSEIQGRVVGAPAEIVSKLRVRAVPRAAAEESVGSDNPPALAGAARTARCDADGSFTLKGLKRSQRYRLIAQESTRDFFRGSRSVPVNAQSGDRSVELVFKPETALVFQVVDAKSGNPVVDLGVQAGYSFPLPLMDDEGRPVKRFPEGRVRYGGLPAAPRPGSAGGAATNAPAESGLKLRVEAPGYQAFERSDIAVIEGQDTDLGVLRLEPAPVVTVLVLDDATGAPIADAMVRLSDESPKAARGGSRVAFTVDDDSGDMDAFGPGTAQRARTGSDGKASVTSLPGKTARISVRHAGYASFQSDPIALPLQDSLEQTVRLSVGGSVTVEVVDSRGLPVPGADVDHQGPNGDSAEVMLSGSDSRTNADGRIVFDHLQTGSHRFRLRQGSGNGVFSVGGGRAVMRRVSRTGGGSEEPGWSSVDVDGHTDATVHLVAPERGTLAGRVTEAGLPLSNATLLLSPKSEDPMPSMFGGGGRNTRTDGRGEYLFDGVDEGEYTVSVEHATRAMTFEATTRVRAGENRLDLDLPVAIVEGTVTDEDGKPVAGARVRAERAPSASGGRRVMGMSVMVLADGGDEPEVTLDSSAGAGPAASTDASGHYSLRGVLADVELVVEANAKDVQPARSAAFTAKPDDVKKNVDLRLERGGTIQISVQRAGKAAGGFLARATLVGSDTAPAAPKVQMVGPSGSAKLTGLKPGKWRVNLDAFGGTYKGGSGDAIPEKEVEVQVGETAQATFQVP